MTTEKKELRKLWMEREAALAPDYIQASNGGIARNLFSLASFQEAQTILLFYSVWQEPDTRPLILHALNAGKTVALPRTYPKGIMQARLLTDMSGLVLSRFGIPEPPETAPLLVPAACDFIVVPAVTFDREGFRLGHGAGYYDRYLLETDAFTCGIARDKMLAERVPRESHDVQVKCLVTEKEIIHF